MQGILKAFFFFKVLIKEIIILISDKSNIGGCLSLSLSHFVYQYY